MAHTINLTLEVRQTGQRKKIPKVLNRFLGLRFFLVSKYFCQLTLRSGKPSGHDPAGRATPHLLPHSARLVEAALKTKLQNYIKTACHFVLAEWPIAPFDGFVLAFVCKEAE